MRQSDNYPQPLVRLLSHPKGLKRCGTLRQIAIFSNTPALSPLSLRQKCTGTSSSTRTFASSIASRCRPCTYYDFIIQRLHSHLDSIIALQSQGFHPKKLLSHCLAAAKQDGFASRCHVGFLAYYYHNLLISSSWSEPGNPPPARRRRRWLTIR